MVTLKLNPSVPALTEKKVCAVMADIPSPIIDIKAAILFMSILIRSYIVE